ncbi:MAG: c-type cytochrome [Rhodobacteraceae bacterium]|nr:c-type cytochrome [Paracoccaceae bacterium]
MLRWIFLFCLLPVPALAQSPVLQDHHLSYAPRSAAELASAESRTTPTVDFSGPEPGENVPAGGATTPRSQDDRVFSAPSANLSQDREVDFKLGRALFHRPWSPAQGLSTPSDGLGPLFNARSCVACHIRDGRGHPPHNGDATSFLLKIAKTGENTGPDPVYGHQLQDLSVQGHAPEFKLRVTYKEFPVTLADGQTIKLRQPKYHVDQLGFGPLDKKTVISPRIAPQMIGLGLLEAIPVEDIVANADPLDADHNGISGRPQVVFSQEFNAPMLGRFGHKAAAATIKSQSAAAFANDIGISTPLHPQGWGDCTAAQNECRAASHGNSAVDGGTEISTEGLRFVTHYARNLGVPARPDAGAASILLGKKVFYKSGCSACHHPKFVTHKLPDQPELSARLIWPYTDMLLHDMGEGLADDFPEGVATGREWRTPPLWGIGLTQQVSGHNQLLHDGRARSLLEAILWHSGEAETAKRKVVSMSSAQRRALIAFLNSL